MGGLVTAIQNGPCPIWMVAGVCPQPVWWVPLQVAALITETVWPLLEVPLLTA